MNNQIDLTKFIRVALLVSALVAAIIFIPNLHAQLATTKLESRFLLVFNTSTDMKKRAPAVQKALDELLGLSVKGELHSGDSLGVWTFDQDLHAGQFPLQHWESADAVMIASNITKFISKQKYSKQTRFAALQPLLNEVVQGSERLTVFIFCDGESPITGTPFDAGINNAFEQNQIALKKAHRPFVVTLRAQSGQYVGCTMSFPPASINLPQFPPLPSPPAPKPVFVPPPPSPAPPVMPSLFITGKTVGTNSPPPPALTNSAPALTNIISPALPTNPISAAPANSVSQTNAVALPPEPNPGGKGFLVAGAIIVGLAIVFGIFLALRPRRKDSSLITRSMNERK